MKVPAVYSNKTGNIEKQLSGIRKIQDGFVIKNSKRKSGAALLPI